MKSKKALSILIVAIGIVSLLSLGVHALHNGEKAICTNIQKVFEESIHDDCHNRLNDIQNLHSPFGRKMKGIRIKTDTGTDTIFFKDNIDEAIGYNLSCQYALLDLNPIQPDTLNALFQKELEKHGIFSMNTGIIYTCKGEKRFSGNDSTRMQSAHLTTAQVIDLKGLASVQGWAEYDCASLLSHIPNGQKWGFLLYAAVLMAAGIAWAFMQRKQKWQEKERAYQHEVEMFNEEREKENARTGAITIGEMLFYGMNKTVYIGGRQCPMRPSTYDFLLLLAQAPRHTLPSQTILDALWSNSKNPKSSYHTALHQLRTAFCDFPGYDVHPDKEGNCTLLLP